MLTTKHSFIYLSIMLILLSVRVAFAQQNENETLQNHHQTPSNSAIDLATAPLMLNSTAHVIANQDIPNNELSLNELRAIFSLRARKWPDGSPITVFVLRDEHKAHHQFLLKTLKMLPHQLRRQWDRYIYSGIGQGPTVLESQEEMLSKVKATPGGIGYTEGGVLDDSVHHLSIR